MKPLYGFMLAWNMLTIVPLFRVHTFFRGINAYSAMFYPLVGMLLGVLLYGSFLVLDEFFPTTYALIVVFFLWVVATGALHLDGLSDTIDGLFVRKERALAVMKDAYVGGMGMLFSVSFLILKAASVAYLSSPYLLILVLGIARLGMLWSIYLFDYVSDGVGGLVKEELRFRHVGIATAYVAVVAWAFDALYLLGGVSVSLVAAAALAKRYGGLSGDMYGFIVEISEVSLLLAVLSA